MSYSSPLPLLLNFAGDVEVIPANHIQLKRRIAAEFELSGKDYLEFDGREYSRHEVSQLLEQLMDEEVFEAHNEIHTNGPLFNFLTKGDKTIFKIGTAKLSQLSPEAKRLVSQHFADKYSKELGHYFGKGTIEAFTTLLFFPIDKITEGHHLNRASKHLENRLYGINSDAEQIAESCELALHGSDPKRSGDLILSKSTTLYRNLPFEFEKKTKSLPEDYNFIRDQMAGKFSTIAAYLNNHPQKFQTAHKFAVMAFRVAQSPELKEELKPLLSVVNGNLSQNNSSSGTRWWPIGVLLIGLINVLRLCGSSSSSHTDYTLSPEDISSTLVRPLKNEAYSNLEEIRQDIIEDSARIEDSQHPSLVSKQRVRFMSGHVLPQNINDSLVIILMNDESEKSSIYYIQNGSALSGYFLEAGEHASFALPKDGDSTSIFVLTGFETRSVKELTVTMTVVDDTKRIQQGKILGFQSTDEISEIVNLNTLGHQPKALTTSSILQASKKSRSL